MFKHKTNKTSGITLIALVVTIIVLLILAGISISMLSGDNGILTQTSNAKIQTDMAEEKEILQMATLAAISKENYGDLSKDKIEEELNKYSEIESTEQIDTGIIAIFKSNRAYLINSDGNILIYHDINIENLIIKDGNTTIEENCKSVQFGRGLTINFEASIPGGSITSISPTLPYSSNGTETKKAFTITGKSGDGESVTKTYTVNLKGYYNIPDLKVGDFVNYTLKAPSTEELNILNSDISTYSGATDNSTKTATENTLLCRVLEMDLEGNPTKLISANGVNSLKLQGANGYNNAVYLINEMCKTLYSGTLGTTTNLTIEDLENIFFDSTALNNAKGDTYGVAKYYSNNAQYPNIALEEAGMGIGTTLINGKNELRVNGLSLSEQMTTYIGSGDAKNLPTTNKGITVAKTSYQINKGNSNYKTATLNNIIHNSPSSSFDTTDVTPYWIASRCVTTDSDFCYFFVRSASKNLVGASFLFTSNGNNSYSFSNAVRPVITLKIGIEATYIGKYNSTYNIWNLQ